MSILHRLQGTNLNRTLYVKKLRVFKNGGSKLYGEGAFKRSRRDIDDMTRTELAPLYIKWVLQDNGREDEVKDTPLETIRDIKTNRLKKEVAEAIFGNLDEIMPVSAWKQDDGSTKNHWNTFVDYLKRNEFEYKDESVKVVHDGNGTILEVQAFEMNEAK